MCCIASREEALLAARYGASAIGLVSAMPSGPGVIPDERIHEVAACAPPGVATFLLTALTEPSAIIAQHAGAGTDTLQLVNRVDADTLRAVRQVLPEADVVPVIHVEGPDALTKARALAPDADGLLLDSGRPAAAIQELGGTGRTHDWNISREIVETVDIPVYLAGGLTPGNVAAAVDAVRPYGVDVCSGLRTGDVLDEAKLAAFMAALGYA